MIFSPCIRLHYNVPYENNNNKIEVNENVTGGQSEAADDPQAASSPDDPASCEVSAGDGGVFPPPSSSQLALDGSPSAGIRQ